MAVGTEKPLLLPMDLQPLLAALKLALPTAEREGQATVKVPDGIGEAGGTSLLNGDAHAFDTPRLSTLPNTVDDGDLIPLSLITTTESLVEASSQFANRLLCLVRRSSNHQKAQESRDVPLASHDDAIHAPLLLPCAVLRSLMQESSIQPKALIPV
jgi:hypothetical protein